MAILRIWDEASQSYQEIPALVGPKGDKGDKGDTGDAGPNEVGTSTDSSITGLLKGASGKVAQAVAGEDYVIPSALDSYIPSSQKSQANGVATLDSYNKVDSFQVCPRLVFVMADKTLSAEDNNTVQVVYSDDPITIFLPPTQTALLVSSEIEIIRFGDGDVTITPVTSGPIVYINGHTNSLTIDAQYASIVLRCIMANQWVAHSPIVRNA